jgi:hypothetical protein
VHVTSTINSSITFNYTGGFRSRITSNHTQSLTGTSIRIHTLRSSRGGVFAVFVDGFNTTSTIDTFTNESTLSPCYPVQFPPFIMAPPTLAATDRHSITLTYTGPSPKAPNGSASEVQFDSFSIPQFQSPATANSGNGLKHRGTVLLTTVALMIAVLSTSGI